MSPTRTNRSSQRKTRPAKATPASENALFERAKELYQAGDVAASRKAFEALTGIPRLASEGSYGLGLLALNEGDLDTARLSFADALDKDPMNFNASYQIGMIALKLQDFVAARAIFTQVLSVNPQHRAAQQRLQELDGGAAGPAPAPGPAEQAAAGRLGVYEFLRRDKSLLSHQTIDALDALDFDVRPPSEAFLSLYVKLTMIGLLMVGNAAFLKWRFPGAGPWFAVLSVPVLMAAVMLWLGDNFVRRIRYRVSQGRLQVTSGIFGSSVASLELWRVQDIDLRRTFIDQQTGYGELVFLAGTERPFRMRGVVQGPELDALHQQFLNAVFLLRSNPVVHGIVL